MPDPQAVLLGSIISCTENREGLMGTLPLEHKRRGGIYFRSGGVAARNGRVDLIARQLISILNLSQAFSLGKW